MEKLTKLEDFQTYVDYIKWHDDYEKHYGNPSTPKPELSENVKTILDNKTNSLKPTNLSYDLFGKILINRLNQLIPNCVIDDDNKKLIENIAKFSTREGVYANQGNKGFLIMGGTGTGKTKIANAFVDILKKFFRMRIVILPSYKYVEDFTKTQYEGLVNNVSSMRFIDDLGSENLFNNYGVTTNVILEFIYRAYDKGIICFATTNLDPASLKKFYGERGYSRMVEMFNFFSLKGDDKRG